ncbi:Transcriptional regulatory protein RstA [Roseimaritima multifibrata]|uniref:Transcriptional regulatory protein RstA n=1 Tax=Roseimaritima multifibrata TaxID=1930274 RepID=A0A517MLH0_9BACT|nr:response regulator transcription factor [Roseimaritima multifibrata]QDS95700.1 Transcriptional regulatory protein RstA [Roseimaritima multifibrata]
MTYQLLLVEDDHELASMVTDFLRGEGYAVTSESNGKVAAQRIQNESYDAVILDIGLPGMDGITICKTVRPHFEGPILVLTARGDEIDEVVALEVGADDYMAKPVRPRALLARLKVHLRRNTTGLQPPANSRICVNDLTIDAASRTVEVGSKPVSLTTAEFDLLWYLAERAGTVVQRSDIYEALQGLPYDGLDRSIDLRVSRLRKKIELDSNTPLRVKSIRGIGYLLAT